MCVRGCCIRKLFLLCIVLQHISVDAVLWARSCQSTGQHAEAVYRGAGLLGASSSSCTYSRSSAFMQISTNTDTHTHTSLTALFLGLPRWASTRKVKPVWILLKQETVSGTKVKVAGPGGANCRFAQNTNWSYLACRSVCIVTWTDGMRAFHSYRRLNDSDVLLLAAWWVAVASAGLYASVQHASDR